MIELLCGDNIKAAFNHFCTHAYCTYLGSQYQVWILENDEDFILYVYSSDCLGCKKYTPYIEEFVKAGADIITVHQEACVHLHRTIQLIKSFGIKAGVSINPATPIGVLEDILADVDLVLVMSVNPGFGGQSFIENALDKVRRLKAMINEKGAKCLIQVDGGVTTKNARALEEAGADVLVAGSAVFGAKDPMEAMQLIKG